MGRKRTDHHHPRSQTLPSSPTHSSSSTSSSDFEFTISLSPRKSSVATFRPADELFYKGQLLPLPLSPRISMVRTLLLASSSTSSSSTTTASRDSTASSLFSTDCDSSRPSSVTEEDELNRILNPISRKTKYFSKLSRISSVFRRDPSKIQSEPNPSNPSSSSSVRRMSSTAKEMIWKYLKKVKPFYEKLSQNQRQQPQQHHKLAKGVLAGKSESNGSKSKSNIGHSFSGNLRYPRKASCVASCPSSMRSSPSHSGILSRGGFVQSSKNEWTHFGDASSTEELHNAIQSAIVHCKNSMLQNKTMVSCP